MAESKGTVYLKTGFISIGSEYTYPLTKYGPPRTHVWDASEAVPAQAFTDDELIRALMQHWVGPERMRVERLILEGSNATIPSSEITLHHWLRFMGQMAIDRAIDEVVGGR